LSIKGTFIVVIILDLQIVNQVDVLIILRAVCVQFV